MSKLWLDQTLIEKISKKLGKDPPNIRVRISKKAAKLGISSEAALILMAKESGIGTAAYQRKIDSAKQAEVRDSLPILFPIEKKITGVPEKSKRKTIISGRTLLKAAIEYLIKDEELKERCSDLLLAKSNFDRAINQATLLLEHRIREKTKPTKKLTGESLVNLAINSNLSKTILEISKNPDEQKGFADILRGVMLAFRNKTHHHIIKTFTREEALRICGFIDILLYIIDKSIKIQ